MTRAQDLANWLADVLGSDAVCVQLDELPTDDMLPGAAVRWQGVEASDTLDGTLIVERYAIVLLAQRTGAKGLDVAQQLGAMERAVTLAALSSSRSSSRWEHLTVEALGGQENAAVLTVRLWVRGE